MKGEVEMNVVIWVAGEKSELVAQVSDDLSGWPYPAVIMAEKDAAALVTKDPLDLGIGLDSGAVTWGRVVRRVPLYTQGKVIFITGAIPEPTPLEISDYYGAWHL